MILGVDVNTINVSAGTIAVYADLGCPWAHLAVHRLHETRARLNLNDSVAFDIRAFPLELINAAPTPKLILDAEIPVAGALTPEAGWRMWQAPVHEWPVTVLLATEAVAAAKEQGLAASETLDRALRRALFAESRTISMPHVISEIAQSSAGVDADALQEALLGGRARRSIERDMAAWADGAVRGSPHVFLPDGTDVHNPGITLRWEGAWGIGFPVVDQDDDSIYTDLLRRAAVRRKDN